MPPDDFFDYRPTILGFAFDLDSQKNLDRVKEQVIELARTFEADTEDKLYVYHPDHKAFDTFMSESIARVANWTRPTGSLDWGDGPFLDKANPYLSLMGCHRLLGRTSPDERRHIILITDRNEKMALGSVGTTCQHIAREAQPNLKLSVIGIGTIPDFATRTSFYTFAGFHHLSTASEFTKAKLQEIING